MSNKRRDKILELIRKHDIETQQDLTVALSEVGFDVTQATVSRDIKELGLIKRLNGNGKYVYTTNRAIHDNDEIVEKMSIIFSKSVVSADCALNIIVLKTLTGMAQGSAAALDAMHYPGILGTIAGDDTIFIVAGSEDAAQKLCRKIKTLIG